MQNIWSSPDCFPDSTDFKTLTCLHIGEVSIGSFCIINTDFQSRIIIYSLLPPLLKTGHSRWQNECNSIIVAALETVFLYSWFCTYLLSVFHFGNAIESCVHAVTHILSGLAAGHQSLAAVTITNMKCCFLSFLTSWEDPLWQLERNKQQQTIASARGTKCTKHPVYYQSFNSDIFLQSQLKHIYWSSKFTTIEQFMPYISCNL